MVSVDYILMRCGGDGKDASQERLELDMIKIHCSYVGNCQEIENLCLKILE